MCGPVTHEMVLAARVASRALLSLKLPQDSIQQLQSEHAVLGQLGLCVDCSCAEVGPKVASAPVRAEEPLRLTTPVECAQVSS
jgi:hypothetical protein